MQPGAILLWIVGITVVGPLLYLWVCAIIALALEELEDRIESEPAAKPVRSGHSPVRRSRSAGSAGPTELHL